MELWSPVRPLSLRALLGTSALADLLVGLPEEIVGPTLSITGGIFGGPTVEFVTTWVMFGIAFYTFGPLALENLEQLPTDDRIFIALFGLCAVAVGIAIDRLDTLSHLFLIAIPMATLCGGLLLHYLVRNHDWQLGDPDSRAVGLLETITPRQDISEEIATDLAYDGWLGVVAKIAFILAVSMILTMTIFCAAMAAQILIFSFPIPDVMFLGWAISARVFPQLEIGPNEDRVNNIEFDLEAFLLDKIELATRSIQGMFTTLFVLLGLFVSGGSLFIVVNILPEIVALYTTALSAGIQNVPAPAVILLWNWTGILLLLLSGGTIGFWAWIRELQRLPHFLNEWEGQFDNLVEPPPRVTGFLLLPIMSWFVAVWSLYFVDLLVVSWYTFVWPIVIPSAAILVWHTNRREPQLASSEHIWIVFGLIIQTLSIWCGVNLRAFVRAHGAGGAVLSLMRVPIMIVLFLLVVGSVPSVSRFERRYEDIRSYSLVGLLFVLSGLGFAGYRFGPQSYRVVSASIAFVSAGFGILIGIVRYYDL